MKNMEPSQWTASGWLTAEEIAARYIVSEETLLTYSQRGTLALQRSPEGTVRFDERGVARIFRPRNRSWAPLGVLGRAVVGEAPRGAMEPAPSSTRRMRRSGSLAFAGVQDVERRRYAG